MLGQLEFANRLLEQVVIDPQDLAGGGLEQASRGQIVDLAGHAAREVVNGRLHRVVEHLGIASGLAELEVDVAGGLLAGEGSELVADRDSKAPFDPKLRASAVLEREAMRRGLLLFPCTGCVEGVAGDMMLVTPPLIITRAQVDEMIDIMKESVSATQHWLRKAG